MSPWQTSNGQWMAWIDEDSATQHPVWVSCDDFDEDLRGLLERAPFLGGGETTVVSVGDLDPVRPLPFDDEPTVVRYPAGDPEAAQTLVRGELPPMGAGLDAVAAAEAVSPSEAVTPPTGLQVGLAAPESMLDVELEQTTTGPEPRPLMDSDAVFDPAGTPEPLPESGDVDGLYIPALTRRPNDDPGPPPGPVVTGETIISTSPPAVRTGDTIPPDAEEAPIRETVPADSVSEDSGEYHADQSAASSQTAGEIVALEDDEAAAAYAEAPSGKIHLDASITGGRIADVAEDEFAPEQQTGELEADDMFDEEEMLAKEPAPVEARKSPPTPPPGKAEPRSDPPAPAAVSANDAPPQTAAPPPPPPPREPLQREGPPPPPEGPRPVAAEVGARPPPPRTTEEGKQDSGSSEAAAALRQLRFEVGGDGSGSAAANVASAAAAEKGSPAPVDQWHETAFADHFAALARPGQSQAADGEIEFFVASTGLAAGSRVLDVGCGDGSHAIALARRGYVVTAYDGSLSQLLHATQSAEAIGAPVNFVHGDMREPPVDGPFDGMLCVGTTLGYFDDDANRKSLLKMRDLLAPGGKLLLGVFNRDYVIGRLPARSWWQGRGCLVLDEAQMNFFTNRLEVHRTVVFEDGRQFEHRIVIRAFSAHDLGRLCVEVGLRIVEISGSLQSHGRFYGATSPDIWLLVERAPSA